MLMLVLSSIDIIRVSDGRPTHSIFCQASLNFKPFSAVHTHTQTHITSYADMIKTGAVVDVMYRSFFGLRLD